MSDEVKVKIENCEIRGCEKKRSKAKEDGTPGREFLIVHYEDGCGKPHEIQDQDVENEAVYKRGRQCHIIAILKSGFNWARLYVDSIVDIESA